MKNGFILFLSLFFGIHALSAQTVGKRLYPTDDTYVFSKGDAENDVIRHLTDPNGLKSYTHQSLDIWSYKSYLKFDISAICNNPDMIEKVVLKMVGREDQGSFSHKISVYALAFDDWVEDELNYNNRESVGDATKITTVTKTVGTDADKWFDFDITAKIKEYKSAGKNTISLMISDDTNIRDSNNQGSVITFYSKDDPGTNTPRLAVDEKDYSALLLTDITVDGDTVDDFNSEVFHYDVAIDPTWTTVPDIDCAKADTGADVNIVKATGLTGSVQDRTTTIEVSKAGLSMTYTLTFGSSSVSSNNLLKKITIDGTDIENFNSKTFSYKCFFPYTYNKTPAITYTVGNKSQKVTVTNATNISSSKADDRTAKLKVSYGNEEDYVEYSILFEVLPKLDLYLCIGQSNMAGRGYMVESLGDLNPVENCYLFTDKFGFEEAVNPLNKYSNIRKSLDVQEISPAYGFGKYIVENVPNQKIGLIVNAKGGTSIEEWQKGQNLYTQTVNRTQKAYTWGELRGIIWHQGESNSSSAKVAVYLDQLNSMVKNLRSDLSSPNAYFLAGELISTYSGATNYNTMIHGIANVVSNSDWVSAAGLTPRKGDNTHFSREGNITLGERYAEKVIEKYYTHTGFSDAEVSTNGKHIVSTENDRTLKLGNLSEKSVLSVFNATGERLLFETNAENGYSFTISGKGLYIINVKNNMDNVSQKIMIK